MTHRHPVNPLLDRARHLMGVPRLAAALRVKERTVYHWINGDRECPPAIDGEVIEALVKFRDEIDGIVREHG